ncbi:MAG: 50S ribosomal protein L15 [Candidatus Omnitrophota bacterium]
MLLSKMRSPKGAKRKKTRLGRGVGSGHGKTSCRGHKGLLARAGSGGKLGQGFEGGQMPLIRRIPKRGFSGRRDNIYQVVNLGSLSILKDKETISPQDMKECGLVKSISRLIKVLGDGQIERAVTVRSHAFSASAKKKIEKAGGKTEIIQRSAKKETKE